ncbi:hypothetical protein [Desulfonema magnum]|uniref:Uncharacterized protein n=1 Tax=Desulfonema magnum TaxID=45655 RepID=A0A975BI31_9BACT|nr:hypothetical protein [Desulfonema magnum]QTA85897.1 Uncharacterized protein dnm_019140 [Desulfonema magnum]
MAKRSKWIKDISDLSRAKTGQGATIAWPSPDGCLPTFPELNDLEKHSSYEANEQLVPFLEAIRKAESRLWIIDKNFLQKKKPSGQNGIDTICEAVAVSNVEDIKIIAMPGGSKRATAEDEVKRLKNARKDHKAVAESLPIAICTNLVNKRMSSLIHDRFAIVDNVLWHFGSDVGGRDAALNAVSLGWNAGDTNAGDFFTKLWIRLGCEPIRR